MGMDLRETSVLPATQYVTQEHERFERLFPSDSQTSKYNITRLHVRMGYVTRNCSLKCACIQPRDHEQVAHFPQQCHNSKFVIFQERILKDLKCCNLDLKCYNFLWVQRRQNCSPAASFANSVMTLYLLKVHLQTFLSIPITQKCQILTCDPLFANERSM